MAPGEGRCQEGPLARASRVPTRAAAGTGDSKDPHPGRWVMRGGSMGSTAIVAAPQHMQALERANQVRLASAELKRRVDDGEMTVAAIVLECPWEAKKMAIGDLLASQHRWGRTRCRRFLAQIPMTENKTIGSMTDRQRHALI